ncbi:MAG: hypothetical protein ACOX3T_06445 [Bdellovibrionota bacterium]
MTNLANGHHTYEKNGQKDKTSFRANDFPISEYNFEKIDKDREVAISRNSLYDKLKLIKRNQLEILNKLTERLFENFANSKKTNGYYCLEFEDGHKGKLCLPFDIKKNFSAVVPVIPREALPILKKYIKLHPKTPRPKKHDKYSLTVSSNFLRENFKLSKKVAYCFTQWLKTSANDKNEITITTPLKQTLTLKVKFVKIAKHFAIRIKEEDINTLTSFVNYFLEKRKKSKKNLLRITKVNLIKNFNFSERTASAFLHWLKKIPFEDGDIKSITTLSGEKISLRVKYIKKNQNFTARISKNDLNTLKKFIEFFKRECGYISKNEYSCTVSLKFLKEQFGLSRKIASRFLHFLKEIQVKDGNVKSITTFSGQEAKLKVFYTNRWGHFVTHINKDDIEILKEFIEFFRKNKDYFLTVSLDFLREHFGLSQTIATNFLHWLKTIPFEDGNTKSITTLSGEKIKIELAHTKGFLTTKIKKKDIDILRKFITFFTDEYVYSQFQSSDKILIENSTIKQVVGDKYCKFIPTLNAMLDDALIRTITHENGFSLNIKTYDNKKLRLEFLREPDDLFWDKTYYVKKSNIKDLEQILLSLETYYERYKKETNGSEINIEDFISFFSKNEETKQGLKINEADKRKYRTHSQNQKNLRKLLNKNRIFDLLISSTPYNISDEWKISIIRDIFSEGYLMGDHLVYGTSAFLPLTSRIVALGTYYGLLSTYELYSTTKKLNKKDTPISLYQYKLNISEKIHEGLIINIISNNKYFATITDKEIQIYDRKVADKKHNTFQKISSRGKVIVNACFLKNSSKRKMVILYSDATIELWGQDKNDKFIPEKQASIKEHDLTKPIATNDGNFIASSRKDKIYKYEITESGIYRKKLAKTSLDISYISDIKYSKSNLYKDDFFIIDEEMNLTKYRLNSKDNKIKRKYALALHPYIENDEKPIYVIERKNIVYIALAGIENCRILKLEKNKNTKPKSKESEP